MTGKSVVSGSAKADALAAATEAVISVPEDSLHCRRGRKTSGQAAKDTTKSTANAATIGVATAGAVKVTAMAGVGLSLGALGTPVMTSRGIVFARRAIRRVYKAAKHELPLDEFRIFFRKEGSCRYSLVREVVAKSCGKQLLREDMNPYPSVNPVGMGERCTVQLIPARTPCRQEFVHQFAKSVIVFALQEMH